MKAQIVTLSFVIILGVVLFCSADNSCLNSKQVVGGNKVLAGGAGLQHLPFAAYNPAQKNYLLLWAVLSEAEQSVWAAFVNPTTLTTSTPIQLYTGPASRGPFSDRPDAAYNSVDGEFLVSWSVYDRSGGCQHSMRQARRLSASGQWMSEPFILAEQNCRDSANSYYKHYQLVFNPLRREFVTVSTNKADGRVFVQRFAANGQRIGITADINIRHWGRIANAHLRHDPRANRYLVTWDLRGATPYPNQAVIAQLLSWNLEELGDDRVVASQNAVPNSQLVYSASRRSFLLFWQGSNGNSLKSRIVTTNGNMSPETSVPLSGRLDDVKPNPFTNGFTVLYRPANEAVRFVRLGPNRSTGGLENLLTCEEVTYPGLLVFNPELHEYFAVWTYYEDNALQKDIFGQRVRATPLH